MKQSVVGVALAAVAALSLGACGSRPKLAPTTGATTPPPATGGPSTAPTAPVQSSTGAAVPGSVQDFVVNAGDRIYFDVDSYSIRDDARPVLTQQAAWLQRFPAVRVRIEGNADERGTREYNFALGARRANAVRDFLVGQGVSPARIETISYGKERPLDSGTGEESWARNRNSHTAITSGAR